MLRCERIGAQGHPRVTRLRHQRLVELPPGAPARHLPQRCTSAQIGRGIPVTQVAAQLGHSRKRATLDTYSHVLIANEHFDAAGR